MKKRTEEITIYLTPEEKEFYKRYANAKEYSLSQLFRYAMKRLTTTSPIKGVDFESNGSNI